MQSLPHAKFATLSLDVDFAAVIPIGAVRGGHRGIAPVMSGRCVGERLNASVRPGHDWYIGQPDGFAIDVRLTLDSDDGVILYLNYTGTMRANAEAMARFGKGEKLATEDYSLHVIARFECGHPRYSWLNDALIVGVGEQTLRGPIYHLFEIGA